MGRRRLIGRFSVRRTLYVVLAGALTLASVLAVASAATAADVASEGTSAAEAASAPRATVGVANAQTAATGVDVIADSPAVALGAWSTVPVQINLVPSSPGTVLYRWGPAPGQWRQARGPILAPEGKQVLSYVLLNTEGHAGDFGSVVVRSDFHEYTRRPAATGIAPAAVAPLIASGSVSVHATVLGPTGVDIRRLGGRARYETGVLISQATFANASTVLVASGENFPDALTASGLAGCLKAPVLLTQRKSLPSAVATEIGRLGATKAIICGGPAAVDPIVENQLKALGVVVERIGGANRYAVAAAVAQRIELLAGTRSQVFIARGDLYPDSLALAPAAYSGRTPILLVLPGSMPSETSAQLGRGNYTAAYIAGGTSSVGGGVASQVAAITGGPATRWAGPTRYETAVTIAQNTSGFGNTWSCVGVATGEGFADALGGGVAAGEKGGVIVLTQAAQLTAPTRQALEAHIADVHYIDVYGGTVAVSAATYEAIRAVAQ